ncbi:hypothetical protein ACUSIJ_01780 [Pseudochelatococcus sp. B33]
MTELTRFLALHALIGFAVAGLFAGLLFGLDVAGLRSLVAQSQAGWIAAGALTFLLCLTFGSVQMGIAVMQLGADERPRGSRRRVSPARAFGPVPQAVPVRVCSR